MKTLINVFLYALIILCGAFAVTEMMEQSGNVGAFIMIIAGLCLIVYIMRLPVEVENPQ